MSLDCSGTTLNIFILRSEAQNGTKTRQDRTLMGIFQVRSAFSVIT